MVSRLPLWQHGFGKSAHPTPGSCFERVRSRVGLKGLALFYCMAEKNPHILPQSRLFYDDPLTADTNFWLVVKFNVQTVAT
jgi:hypothetical protein